MAKSPAFQFYPKDWFSDAKVRAMTLEAKGAYIDLLGLYWLEEGLPADTDKLARLLGVAPAKFRRLWPEIEPCFRVEGDRIYQKRMDQERTQQDQFREERAKAGRHGAEMKKQKASSAKAQLQNSESTASDLLQAKSSSSSAVSVLPSAVTTIPIPPGEDTALNRSILASCAEIAELTGKEPTEILKAHSMVPPRKTGERAVWIVNLATASEGWRIRTSQDLHAELSRLKAPPPPVDAAETHEGLLTRGPWESQ